MRFLAMGERALRGDPVLAEEELEVVAGESRPEPGGEDMCEGLARSSSGSRECRAEKRDLGLRFSTAPRSGR